MRIDPIIRNLSDAAAPKTQKTGSVSAGVGSFADQLATRVGEVSHLQTQADQAMAEGSVTGSNIHETMITLEKAEVGLRYLTKFRNKALEAYNEMMRMQF